MSHPGWSDERVTTLKALWLDGLSASQIAAQLGGVTRNAVIGKIHRFGLSGRALPSKPARLARPPQARAPRCAARPQATPVRQPSPCPAHPNPIPEAPGLAASVTLLGAHVCRWPIGDPKADGFSFCGRPAHGPYCPRHKALAFRPGTAWQADRDPVVRLALAGRV